MKKMKRSHVVLGLASTVVAASSMMPAHAAPVESASKTASIAELDLQGKVVAVAEKEQKSTYYKKGISTVEDSLFIREGASSDTNAVGILYANGTFEVVGVSGDWVRVKAGDVEGYVSSEFIVMGLEAETYAAENNLTEDDLTQADSLVVENTETSAPETKAPETKEPETKAPETSTPVEEVKVVETAVVETAPVVDLTQPVPETQAPETSAPETETTAPETYAPETQAPETSAPETETTAPDTYVTETETETETTAPDTYVTETETETQAPETSAPETETQAPETQAPEVYISSTYEYLWATEYVNVRDTYSTDGAVIGGLSANDSIVRTGICDNGWSQIEYNGGTGYVYSDFLTSVQPETQPETVPETTPETSYEEPSYEEPSAPSYNSSTGASVVAYARQFIGYPYVYGGNSLTGGIDCSGFTQQILAAFGYSIPRTADSQAYAGTEVSMDQAQPGDLVLYDYGSGWYGHVAIYAGGGSIVHASNEETGIIETSMYYGGSPSKFVRVIW